jgi:threonine aldolase
VSTSISSRARGFSSDNAAGIHPTVLAAIVAANEGHAPSYGADPLTAAVTARLEEIFGAGTRSFLVYNGTGANVLALRAACRPWEAAICADVAHINTDETGAPEALAGVKLLAVPAPDGLLTPALVDTRLNRDDEHAVAPRIVSVSQTTELGRVYEPAQLRALADHVHERGLLLHVDGSRLSNAAAALGCGLAEISTGAGADIVSFGGTKNGLLAAEAVVIAEPSLAEGFLHLRKQSLQLASKMRFLAAQFDAYLTDELWRANASHANAMAGRLAAAVTGIPGIEIVAPVQANAVFAALPDEAVTALQAQFAFERAHTNADQVRWMCSWDTTEDDVDAFAAAIAEVLATQ